MRIFFAVLLISVSTGCGGGGAADAGLDATTEADLTVLDADDEVDADDESPRLEADIEGPSDTDPSSRCDVDDLEIVEAGELALGGRLEGLTLDPCTTHLVRLVVPEGMEVGLELTPRGMLPILGALTFPDDMSWDRAIRLLRAERHLVPEEMIFEAPRSGELVLLVRASNVELEQSYDLELRCIEGCELETTRYPIVLVHGWTGFDEIGPLEYFYGIPALLRDRGYEVHVAVLDPYNSIAVRSEQLAPQIDEFLEASRAMKVNIIAHSQGGLDSRRLISTLGYGDRVSALITFATPHRGTPLCDAALGLLPGLGEDVMYTLLDLIGAEVMGREGDAEASFAAMTQDHIQNEFNPSNPDDPRVSYISWMGRTCLYGISCDDVCDIEIRWSYDLIYLFEGANDGIVPISSAPWGDYRGEVPADHFDEVGQLFGVTNDHFDHEEFYLQRARDLAAEGH